MRFVPTLPPGWTSFVQSGIARVEHPNDTENGHRPVRGIFVKLVHERLDLRFGRNGLQLAVKLGSIAIGISVHVSVLLNRTSGQPPLATVTHGFLFRPIMLAKRRTAQGQSRGQNYE